MGEKCMRNSYRVGVANNPQPDDEIYVTLEDAEPDAEAMAARDPNQAIAIWDGWDEIVLLLFMGDEFVRRNP